MLAAAYHVTFEPLILREEFPGHLEAVTLHAQPMPVVPYARAARTVFENIGDFAAMFSRLMPPDAANRLLTDLEQGVTILWPDPIPHEALLGIAFNFIELDPAFQPKPRTRL